MTFAKSFVTVQYNRIWIHPYLLSFALLLWWNEDPIKHEIRCLLLCTLALLVDVESVDCDSDIETLLRTTTALSCRFPSLIASVTLRCLFIPRLVLPSSHFEVDGSEIECSRVRLGDKRSVFLATFSWLLFVALCSVFRSTASLTIFPSREIFDRKAHAEAIRRDLFLFVRPAVTAAILAVVDKLSLTLLYCGVLKYHSQPSPPPKNMSQRVPNRGRSVAMLTRKPKSHKTQFCLFKMFPVFAEVKQCKNFTSSKFWRW